MKVDSFLVDLFGVFFSAHLHDDQGEYRLDSSGQVERWVGAPITHAAWPGYWRRPSLEVTASVLAAVVGEAARLTVAGRRCRRRVKGGS